MDRLKLLANEYYEASYLAMDRSADHNMTLYLWDRGYAGDEQLYNLDTSLQVP